MSISSSGNIITLDDMEIIKHLSAQYISQEICIGLSFMDENCLPQQGGILTIVSCKEKKNN